MFDYDTFLEAAIAVIAGDWHSNLAATQALLPVLEEAQKKNIKIISMGDYVGYNAEPNEVCDALRGITHHAVMGNHDLRVAHLDPNLHLEGMGNGETIEGITQQFSDVAEIAADYSAHVLTKRNMTALAELPFEGRVKANGLPIHFFHANVHDPQLFAYLKSELYVYTAYEKKGGRILNSKVLENVINIAKSFEAMRERDISLAIVGHSHHEGLWEVARGDKPYLDVVRQGTEINEDGEIVSSMRVIIPDEYKFSSYSPNFVGPNGTVLPAVPQPQKVASYPISPDKLTILNPGSVGQPRDFHPYASFGVIRSNGTGYIFQLYKTWYDIGRTVKAIESKRVQLIDIIAEHLFGNSDDLTWEHKEVAQQEFGQFYQNLKKRIERGH